MTRPFIPFPIFPPYDHWRPNRVKRFPANDHVSARLSEVNDACFPFMSTWYADRFINWIAHNWNPQSPRLQYYKWISGLEKMLNWSFANKLCLLDWTPADFKNYADFIQTPDSDWASSSSQPRFLISPGMDYRDCPINPHWKLFKEARAADLSGTIDKNVWKREIRCVTQFMEFYLKDVSASRPNVAAIKLDSLAFKQPQLRGVISDVVMKWILATLPSLLGTHKSHVIGMYLTIARYTARPMWQVLGTASSPGRVDQFMRNSHGIWLESPPKNGAAVPLPPAFARAFDRYLIYLNIDSSQPLPASSLFPWENSLGAYHIKGLWRIICLIRESLADAAAASDNPDIAQATGDIRRLTTALVSNRQAT
ncbi:integrase [Pseudomonas frederiksbergensis]|uniref:Integrase n=2 Tax=Pseudomonas frederiksbergensis TaxID=104087 RepID=A0A423KG20_9PSED|nr:integrase [Pseudomonas frederiksbergensis]